ncbi:MAG: actin, cytoplasmic 2 [Candidatus Odinarchaeota archaeon]
MTDELPGTPIVMDNGSLLSKNGFAGDKLPRSVFPTLITYPKNQRMSGTEHEIKDHYIGEEATGLHDALTCLYPIEYGIINDWDGMEKLWHYTFYENLKISPENHPVLLTEVPLNPAKNREKSAEILFESFNCPAVYLTSKATLALQASYRTGGLVVDIGDTATFIVPIEEGFSISHSIYRLDIGGRDITDYLRELLISQGKIHENSVRNEHIRDYKEEFSYVCLDVPRELARHKKRPHAGKKYTFPSGETVIIGKERFIAPEMLFNPAIVGKEDQPVGDAIVNSIMANSVDIRRKLCENIVLTGGSSLFPGLKERLHKELVEEFPEHVKICVIAPPDRQYAAWIGGSILAPSPEFRNSWVTKQEYQKEGARIIYRCF